MRIDITDIVAFAQAAYDDLPAGNDGHRYTLTIKAVRERFGLCPRDANDILRWDQIVRHGRPPPAVADETGALRAQLAAANLETENVRDTYRAAATTPHVRPATAGGWGGRDVSDVTLSADERAAIAALKRLAKRWPSTLWLFSANGTLTVMRKGPDGEHVTDGEGMAQSHVVDEIYGIDNDGGDW